MEHASLSCPALLVTCMDWRLHPAVEQHVTALGHAPFDLISVPGGVKALLDDANPAPRDFLLNCVDISVLRHGVRVVVLVNHTDCAAYGGAAAFCGVEDEFARHRADLAEAASKIRTRSPVLIVVPLLAVVRTQEGLATVRVEPA